MTPRRLTKTERLAWTVAVLVGLALAAFWIEMLRVLVMEL